MVRKYLTSKTWNNSNDQIVTHVGVDMVIHPIIDVITWIENGTYQIVVSVDGYETRVRVGTSSTGTKFLTTNPDGSKCNNIDNLPVTIVK